MLSFLKHHELPHPIDPKEMVQETTRARETWGLEFFPGRRTSPSFKTSFACHRHHYQTSFVGTPHFVGTHHERCSKNRSRATEGICRCFRTFEERSWRSILSDKPIRGESFDIYSAVLDFQALVSSRNTWRIRKMFRESSIGSRVCARL